ncbi:MAG TPA: extracellular solute-binding protein [Thermomicrobiales bacterium]
MDTSSSGIDSARRYLRRRTVLRYGGTAGLLAAFSGILAACGGTTAPPTTAPGASSAASAAPTSAASSSAPATATGGGASPAASSDPSPVASAAPATVATPSVAASGAPLLGYTKSAKVFNGNKIKLTMWNWKQPFEEIYNKYFAQYTQLYPNVEFEQTVVPFAEFLKKIQAGVLAKQAPDMFGMFWLWQPPIVDAKLIRPLPEDRFPQASLEASFANIRATYGGADGKAYWIPLGKLSGGLHINKKIWAKAGLTDKDVPKTWDQVIQVAKQLTVRDNAGRVQVAGYNPTGYIQSTWRYLYYQQGFWSLNKDSSKSYFDTDEMRKSLQFFDDVYKVHKVSEPDFLKFDESFGAEKAAMIFMWTNALPNIRKYPDLQFATYPAPTWSGKAEPAAGHGTLDPQSLVVPVSTPDDRAAVCFDFIQWLYTNKDFLVEVALNQGSPPLATAIVDDPRIKADPIISTLLPQTDYIVQTMGLPQAASDAYTKYAYEAPFVAGTPIAQALKEGQAAVDDILKQGPYYIKEQEYKYASLMKFKG